VISGSEGLLGKLTSDIKLPIIDAGKAARITSKGF
jgi:hypothetical protein